MGECIINICHKTMDYIALDKRDIKINIFFSYFTTHTYAVGTHQKRRFSLMTKHMFGQNKWLRVASLEHLLYVFAEK